MSTKREDVYESHSLRLTVALLMDSEPAMPTLASCKVDSSPLHPHRCYVKLFLRDIMFMKNAESSPKINVLQFHHIIHVMVYVSTLIVGPPLVLRHKCVHDRRQFRQGVC